jgi:hypothetical protein
MAVYYSTTQYRSLGRLLHPNQIRLWIRGGRRNQDLSGRILPTFDQLTRIGAQKIGDRWKALTSLLPLPSLYLSMMPFLLPWFFPLNRPGIDYDPCDPT